MDQKWNRVARAPHSLREIWLGTEMSLQTLRQPVPLCSHLWSAAPVLIRVQVWKWGADCTTECPHQPCWILGLCPEENRLRMSPSIHLHTIRVSLPDVVSEMFNGRRTLAHDL